MTSQATLGRYDPHDQVSQSHSTEQSATHSANSPYPSRPVARQRKSMMDELLPLPTPSSSSSTKKSTIIPLSVLRRTGSVAVITIFLLSIVFLASTEPVHRRTGLRTIFGVGSDAEIIGAGWVAQDLEEALNHKESPQDFDQYLKMETIADAKINDGDRMIFIGDIHGSFAPLQRLLTKIQYDMDKDKIVHVGDLIAKGEKNLEVLDWMMQFKVQGVRGNHDQPVIQWRAWMEWAGGKDWKKFIDDMADEEEEVAVRTLRKKGKQYPKSWKWKSQHWHIARELKPKQYKYLLDLPLALHIPSLHSFVVHAGLLPSDPTKHLSDISQPLVAAAESHFKDPDARRMAEELSILFDVKQNTDPYTLIEMRSVHMKGKKKGKVTKEGSKGTPWSDVWNKEVKRCTRSLTDEERARGDDEEAGSSLECSPVNIIYGHAAGRGLDIKKYTKGLDTGCVYGRQLTALVLGDRTGLRGETVRVEGHRGVLISIDCEEGGK